MYYVVIDLEWNNTYNKHIKAYFNEIIEIGAVMLNENLEYVSSYSVLIRSNLSDKLSNRVVNLTHITNEDMYGGVSREKAFSDFVKWIGDKDCIFMSWGNTDLHVLTENFIYFEDTDYVPFIKKYIDLQNYCQKKMGIGMAQQIGLSSAADIMGIDISKYSTHRALDDSLLAWQCLKKVYDREEIETDFDECDVKYYHRLLFKPKMIINLKDPNVDRSLMLCKCEKCGNYMKRKSPWKNVNSSFSAVFYCKNCDYKGIFYVKFLMTYDGVEVKKRLHPIEKAERKDEK